MVPQEHTLKESPVAVTGIFIFVFLFTVGASRLLPLITSPALGKLCRIEATSFTSALSLEAVCTGLSYLDSGPQVLPWQCWTVRDGL